MGEHLSGQLADAERNAPATIANCFDQSRQATEGRSGCGACQLSEGAARRCQTERRDRTPDSAKRL